jgi:hypothetical protein
VQFLDDLISEPFEKLGLDFRSNLQPGQICQAPVLYSYENTEIWRPSALDASGTAATNFCVTAAAGDAYKKKFILQSPRLEAYEEFPVLRAKHRPVVLLVPRPKDIKIHDVKGGGKINRHLCLVSPCYSVEDEMGKAKFAPEFLKGVRLLEYPQFMFLPKSICLKNDSLLRLDSIQHVFHNHLEASQWRLSLDLLKILLGQVAFLFTRVYSGEYQAARDLLIAEAKK